MKAWPEGRKINVGVVGCGYWGPNLIRNFRSLPDCQMRCMCDTNPDRLAALQPLYAEVESRQDFEDLLRCPELDAVAIATPTRWHYPMARQALLAGKHVLVEKPLARSVAECQDLIELADRHGLVLMVGHTFLYSAAVRAIKAAIAKPEFGPLRYISSRRLNLGLFQPDLNVVWDLAPHDLSIVHYLVGRPATAVKCWGRAHVRPGIEDVASLCVDFGEDTFALIQSSWLDPRKVRDMTIVGAHKMIVYDDLQPLEKVRIYDIRVTTPPYYTTFAEFQAACHYGECRIPHLKQEEPLKVECEHFLACIRNGQRPLTDGAAGLEVVRVLEAASASLRRNGAPVPVGSPAAATEPADGSAEPPGPMAALG